jgi:hypothetical protein
MYKDKSLFCGRATGFLGALLLIQVCLSSAFASSNGSVTTGGFNADGTPVTACSGCHSLNATSVMILGPSSVAHDSVNTYEVVISGAGPGIQGGIDVAAVEGVLGLISSATEGTQLRGESATGTNEVTHDGAKAFSSGTVSWLFTWAARDFDNLDPLPLGSYDIFAQGVNGNNGNGNNNDFTGMTTFTVQVVPIPAAGLLFGSALGLLAWLRRRVT